MLAIGVILSGLCYLLCEIDTLYPGQVTGCILYVTIPRAKQPPSWEVRLFLLTKELSQLGLLTVYIPSGRGEECPKTLP